jgi:hypothetical protein
MRSTLYILTLCSLEDGHCSKFVWLPERKLDPNSGCKQVLWVGYLWADFKQQSQLHHFIHWHRKTHMQSESATVYLIDPLLLIANSWSSSYEAVEHQLNKLLQVEPLLHVVTKRKGVWSPRVGHSNNKYIGNHLENFVIGVYRALKIMTPNHGRSQKFGNRGLFMLIS